MIESPSHASKRPALLLLAAASVLMSGCLTQRDRPPPSPAIQQVRAAERKTTVEPCVAGPSTPVFVPFGFAEAEITDLQQPYLAPALSWTACHRDTPIAILPAADSHGTAEQQQALANRRAQAVAAYLKAHGVANPIVLLPEGGAEPAGPHLLVQAWGRRW